jgi:hypothetical protein
MEGKKAPGLVVDGLKKDYIWYLMRAWGRDWSRDLDLLAQKNCEKKS